jgi:hypothetical protein
LHPVRKLEEQAAKDVEEGRLRVQAPHGHDEVVLEQLQIEELPGIFGPTATKGRHIESDAGTKEGEPRENEEGGQYDERSSQPWLS